MKQDMNKDQTKKFKIPSGELVNADCLRDHLLGRLASLVSEEDQVMNSCKW